MKKKSNIIQIAIFFIIIFAVIVYYNMNKPRLLILNSYDENYAWTRDVNVGVKRILHDKKNFYVRWYYMDTKRHPSAADKIKAGIAARHMINQWQPDVILAIDDDAQEYAAKHYVNHNKIKIVFAGINGEMEPYGYQGAGNITGILERKKLHALKEALLYAFHNKKMTGNIRLLYMGDNSKSVQSDEIFVKSFNWSPAKLVDSKLVDTFDEWKDAVRLSDRIADVIIVENYRKLKRNKNSEELVPPKEVIKWTEENSSLPIIGTNGFFVEDGGMLSVATSPYEQGEVAAAMAVEILENKKEPDRIPITSTKQVVIFMRESQMKSHNFVLPEIYEDFARATNNFYK